MRTRIWSSGMAVFAIFASVPIGVRAQNPPEVAQPVPPARAQLESRVRERMADVVRRRLELSDDQMKRLASVKQQFDQQRVALVSQERQTRQALRTELVAGSAANQQKVATLLDQMLRFQRQRLDLVESEQRELGKFLTPVQRAKYLALQVQIRNRMEQLRDRGPRARPSMGPRPGMAPRPGMQPMPMPLPRRNFR